MLGSSRGGGAEGSLVAQTLEGSMEELFGPYLEGARYLERESKSLGELYGVFLGRFSKYHVSPLSFLPFSVDSLHGKLTIASPLFLLRKLFTRPSQTLCLTASSPNSLPPLPRRPPPTRLKQQRQRSSSTLGSRRSLEQEEQRLARRRRIRR